jgi:hypothetical protein
LLEQFAREQSQRSVSALCGNLAKLHKLLQTLTAAARHTCTRGIMTPQHVRMQEELSRAQHAASAEQHAAQEAAEQRQQEAERLLREAQQEMQQQAQQIAALKARQVQEVQQT